MLNPYKNKLIKILSSKYKWNMKNKKKIKYV